ncbi:polysaccharide pyruvyl transferase family protein [Devosia sp. XJ19-1]|uniref:Polysaccharide pyruvyl transferase family protein n=1 Tax=Devosia ureilytica TaxID=2952754 RepID=A0A9Q4AM95_9HYPH|nr:polysaccharide pyruvyl transferase family protein [Devosia ureilytica]MCP8881911.1 polysaccharide pyruvyl transferase family protein [Devosia ureilytica]MCP8886203.1 polysaccharide pyruvyl transferase family protein [Devosia ureilytica]
MKRLLKAILPAALTEFARSARASARRKQFLKEWTSARKACVRREPSTPSQYLLIFPSDPWTISGALGDDAMISAAVQHFAERSASVSTSMFCRPGLAEGVVKSCGFHPVIIPERDSFVGSLQRILSETRADELILLGADIMDGYYDPAGVADMLVTADVAARCGVRTSFLGFSFNEYPVPELAAFYNRVSPEVRFNLRDEISLQRFQQFTSAKANLVADAAFMLRPGLVDVQVKAWIDKQRAQGRVIIGFNVHPMLIKDASVEQMDQIIRRCVEAIQGASRGRDVAFLLLPHDYRNALGDAACLRPIHESLSHDAGVHVYYLEGKHRAADIKALAGQVDGMITGRMHLAIAALGMSVPTLCLTYQDKFGGLIRHFGLPGDLLLSPSVFDDDEALETAVVHFVDKLPMLRQLVAAHKAEVMRLASGNFDLGVHETA